MTTAFRTVQAAIVTALLNSPAIVGTRVYPGRARPMPAEYDDDIAVSIEDVSGQDIALTGAPQTWRVLYGVQIRARGDSSTDGNAALDPLLEDVYERLQSTSPPAGVLGWALQPRIRIDIEEAATPVATAMLLLDVQLRTQAASLNLAS